MHGCREISLKEVADVTVRAGKPGICRAGQWAENSGRSQCCGLDAESFLFWETSVFALKALLYTQSHQIKDVSKHPHSNARIGVWARNWVLGPSQAVTHTASCVTYGCCQNCHKFCGLKQRTLITLQF